MFDKVDIGVLELGDSIISQESSVRRGKSDGGVLFETVHPGLQVLKSGGEGSELGLELGKALGGGAVFGRGGTEGGIHLDWLAGEEVGVTGLPRAGLAGEDRGQRAGSGRRRL
jgi:hypothetical protein